MKFSFEQLHNVRDLGGLSTTDGRQIRPGKLVRGSRLCAASEADLSLIADRAEVIVDLRTRREIEERPDPDLPGTEWVFIPVIELLTAGITREKKSDLEMIQQLLMHPENAMQHMCRMYEKFVTEEVVVRQFEQFIRLLFVPRERAVYWHCTAGKDRVGIAALLLEHLLGVREDLILADYLKSNEEYLEPEMPRLLMMIEKHLGALDPRAEGSLRILFGARGEYMDALYQKVDELYGSMDEFLEDGLRISPDERVQLKKLYLE